MKSPLLRSVAVGHFTPFQTRSATLNKMKHNDTPKLFHVLLMLILSNEKNSGTLCEGHL